MVLDPRYIAAREALLDALDALGVQRAGIVLVGAQAIYLRVGDGGIPGVTPYTLDGDLGIRPEMLSESPELASCLEAGGFRLRGGDEVGIWETVRTIEGREEAVTVDLLVPEAVGGRGTRAARIPPHRKGAARKVKGLEGALFDHDPMTLATLHPDDPRSHRIEVAGPGALLVAKAHKIRDRVGAGRTSTRVAKDALDVVRILRGCEEGDIARRLRALLDGGATDSRPSRTAAAVVAEEAVAFLGREFGAAAGLGCDLAVASAAGAMDEEELRASTVVLTRRLLDRVGL